MNVILEDRIKDKTHRKEIKQNVSFLTLSITEEVTLGQIIGEILEDQKPSFIHLSWREVDNVGKDVSFDNTSLHEIMKRPEDSKVGERVTL